MGRLGIETESIARCSAIMSRCENLILLSNRIELEVLLKFLEKKVKFYYLLFIIYKPCLRPT